MAKRSYKLQEFVAHASDVNCLNIGKKSCRVFVTGGSDRKVNLWAIGQPTSLMSLCGHTSAVQSVTFDSAEVLVLAGSSSGTIKLWDLEEAKIVRTITGHRSSCASVEFHPFGEFFASGSLDADLKIWDIRKKGCIHTYKGHARGIRTIKFSPDGRWVVTGGEDNRVKIWDLTAGKLLHDFKFHNGSIRCIDFHPQEFLLATGSADRTVKFWDLETFELIGSAGPEATGVRSMIFHPDGRTLFCGLDELLKVFAWEPIRCHDNVDMGWSTLGDLSIFEGKLLGCSYNQSRVGVWVADLSLIVPYAAGVVPRENGPVEPVYSHGVHHCVELTGRSIDSSGFPDNEDKTKDRERIPCVISEDLCESGGQGIDPIYSSATTPLNSTVFRRNRASVSCNSVPQKFNSKFSSKIPTLGSKTFRVCKATELSLSTPNNTESGYVVRQMPLSSGALNANSPVSLKKNHMVGLNMVNKTQVARSSVSAPVIVSRDTIGLETAASLRRGTTMETMAHGEVLCKLKQTSNLSFADEDSVGQSTVKPSNPSSSPIYGLKGTDQKFISRQVVTGESELIDEASSACIKKVADKIERVVSLDHPIGLHNDKDTELPCSNDGTSPVKYVKGVAVQLGRTRSLVESWERRERCDSGNTATVWSSSEAAKLDNLPSPSKGHIQTTERDRRTTDGNFACESLLQSHDIFINVVKSRLTKLQVVRHCWEHDGVKGAIVAVAKLPDNSVQADVITVLMEKIELFTLDLFSFSLPLLVGLLNNKIERHVTTSLEMLLRLVKIFGPIIRSTISASSSVGVDLQAEQRLERCNQCCNHLRKIRHMIPVLIRREGLVAKRARELDLALNDS